MTKKTVFFSFLFISAIVAFFLVFNKSEVELLDGTKDKRVASKPSNVTLPTLDSYPVIDDCHKSLMNQVKNIVKNDDSLPHDYIVREIANSAEMYKILQIKPGYTLGRVRATGVALPGPELCYSYFRLGLRQDNSGVILKDNAEILSALKVTEDNLSSVGKLLYGDLDPQRYRELYDKWSKGGDCMKPIMGKCKKISNWPKNVKDGDIVQAPDGSTTLHRFKDIGIGVLILQHHQITLRPDGTTSLTSNTLAEYDTGIMY